MFLYRWWYYHQQIDAERTMQKLLKPVDVPSLPSSVVDQIERLILAGTVKPGERLPAERELAETLGVSRPVVHSAILELEQKGLVTIRPRHGTTVNDYRTSGSAELLTSLWRLADTDLEPTIVESVMEFRVTVEGEAAARLAVVAEAETIALLADILDRADALAAEDIERQAVLDYEFHSAIALHSGNLIYPMVMNSFGEVYRSMLRRFFSDSSVVSRVRTIRRALLESIRDGNPEAARERMRRLSTVATYGKDETSR
jgi:DNA-binding FadR family transcriptional regulator